MAVECSNCGAEIPYAGRVCPFCGHDKSGDKSYAWTKFIGGIVGLVIGFSTFENFLVALLCFFPGYALGAIFGIVAPKKRKLSKTEAASQSTQARTNDSVAGKLSQLKQMHEQGLLTAEEYASKKAEILAKL